MADARKHEHDHEHGWIVESAHETSQGSILYVRCAECGSRRVDLQGRAGRPPVALSGIVREERGRT